jgi:hypothetical protein
MTKTQLHRLLRITAQSYSHTSQQLSREDPKKKRSVSFFITIHIFREFNEVKQSLSFEERCINILWPIFKLLDLEETRNGQSSDSTAANKSSVALGPETTAQSRSAPPRPKPRADNTTIL